MNVSRSLFMVVALVGGLSTGCHARVYGHAHVRYVEPAPVVFVDAPDLVFVEPGIYVVRDCDHAVYYIDGYYYSYRGGSWYHASHWNDPWVSVNINVVPSVVVHRDHRTYVRYHGHAGAHVMRDERPRRHAANPSQGGGHQASQPSRQGSSPSHGSSAPEHNTRSANMSDAHASGKVSSAPQPSHATPARSDHDPKEMRIKTDADIGQRSKDDGPSKPSKSEPTTRASASPSPMKPAAQPSKSKSSPAASAPATKKAPTKKVKKKK